MIKVKYNQHVGLIKSEDEIEAMRKAGHELAQVREKVASLVQPGVTTLELDQVAQELIEGFGAKPAFLGYSGFPNTLCTSINEEIVHGIPSAKRRLKEGDLISVDVGLIHYGFYSDTAVTVGVGQVSPEVAQLIAVTRESLEEGIKAIEVGKRLGDFSAAVQSHAEKHGYGVVREYTGHGIGRNLHEEPKIPNFGRSGTGLRLREGMVLALEPMLNLGTWKTKVLGDDWTVVTGDRKPSAHFEHTIALTKNGVEILTQ